MKKPAGPETGGHCWQGEPSPRARARVSVVMAPVMVVVRPEMMVMRPHVMMVRPDMMVMGAHMMVVVRPDMMMVVPPPVMVMLHFDRLCGLRRAGRCRGRARRCRGDHDRGRHRDRQRAQHGAPARQDLAHIRDPLV